MPGKVFHVSDEVHKLVTQYCKRNDLPPKNWVEAILIQALESQSSMPDKKERTEFFAVPKKRILTSAAVDSDDEPWSQPPFWAKK
jgi:hypothetical protein